MHWFNQLSKSEQKLIKYGSLLIACVLFWTLVYKPLNKSIATKSKSKIELENQLKKMQQSKDMLGNARYITRSHFRADDKPFISWIDETLSKSKLSDKLTRSDPKDNNTLILTFENVKFDKLIQWLEPLELKYKIAVSEADINVVDKSQGICNARITLEDHK